MPDQSLMDFLAQAQRGASPLAGALGPDYLMKQTYFTVDTATGIFNTTYGRKIWHALNNQTRYFNAIRKVTWGTTAGWRIRDDRGTGRSRPITETGTLPTVDISNVRNVSSLPRIVGTTFGAAVKAIFTAQLEGGVGDVLAMENENAQLDHMKEINQELLAASACIASAGSAADVTVPAAFAFHFKIGDILHFNDLAPAFVTNTARITAVAAGVISVAWSGVAPADGDVIYINERAGLTSIDDIVSEDLALAGAGPGGRGTRVRAYDLTAGGRTSGTWNAGALVDFNGGVGQDLSLNLVDNMIRDVRTNGGEPKLLLMGHDQYFRLERLLQTQQRYLGQEEYVVGVGDERTFPGTRTGLVLATYMGIPILPDADTPHSVSTTDVILGSNIYALDTDYLEIAIAQPTQYVENRDYFAANALVVRGLIYTMAEQRCTNFWVQAKVADLNA